MKTSGPIHFSGCCGALGACARDCALVFADYGLWCGFVTWHEFHIRETVGVSTVETIRLGRLGGLESFSPTHGVTHEAAATLQVVSNRTRTRILHALQLSHWQLNRKGTSQCNDADAKCHWCEWFLNKNRTKAFSVSQKVKTHEFRFLMFSSSLCRIWTYESKICTELQSRKLAEAIFTFFNVEASRKCFLQEFVVLSFTFALETMQ